MSYRTSLLVCLGLVSGALAAESAVEKWEKKLEAADAAFQAAVVKADQARHSSLQRAMTERVRLLKAALADATKSGNFAAATALQERLTAAEKDGGVRPRPRITTKFGGHDYALIEEKTTWNVARQICAEMGGHLAIINSLQESQFLTALCGKHDAWVGASDEAEEGDWKWVDGTACEETYKAGWRLTDETGEQHNLLWFIRDQQFAAGRGSARVYFVCEWDK